MPSPWEVLTAAAEGLDPRQVWDNTLNTGGQILEHLDRPRGAIKGSQVNSANAADFFSMLGLGAEGAVKGFINPDDYPAENFLEGLLTDPLTYTGLGKGAAGGIKQAVVRGADEGFDFAKNMKTFISNFKDEEVPKPLRNALTGALDKLDDSDDSLFRLFDVLEEGFKKYSDRETVTRRALEYIDDTLNKMPGIGEAGERWNLRNVRRTTPEYTYRAHTDALDDASAADFDIRRLQSVLNDKTKGTPEWVARARKEYDNLYGGADQLADDELEEALQGMLAESQAMREDYMSEALRMRRIGLSSTGLPGDKGAVSIEPGVPGDWARIASPQYNDPRDAIFELLGIPTPQAPISDDLRAFFRRNMD